MEERNLYYSSQTNWRNKTITVSDCNRILVHIQKGLGNTQVSPDVLHHLYLTAAVSKKYFSNEVPENVVTMNSEVILQFENGQEQRIRLVYPDDITTPCDISIYSPLGAACIGATEKSYIYYSDEAVSKKAFIKRLLFQPEKERLFYL